MLAYTLFFRHSLQNPADCLIIVFQEKEKKEREWGGNIEGEERGREGGKKKKRRPKSLANKNLDILCDFCQL